MKSLDAQIAGLEAQVAQAQTDLTRAEDLFQKGIAPKTRLDEARTASNVATNAMRARTAERSVIQQQLTEGNVLAPAAGRVLKVPLTAGTVVMPGDPVALIAEQNFVVRLKVPERHARLMKVGDPVRIDGDDLGTAAPRFGKISLVYPTDRGRARHRRCRCRGARAITSSMSASGSGSLPATVLPTSYRRGSSRPASVSTMSGYARPVMWTSTSRFSAAVRRRGRTCPTAWKSFPDCRTPTGWCGREARIFRLADQGDHPVAADAAVPDGGAGGAGSSP